MDYLFIKTVHQTAVALSVIGFLARGLMSLTGSPLASTRAAKTLPHVVDSVLLLSALMLVGLLHVNPFGQSWLLAKMIGLLVYIALGLLALKPALPLAVRSAAWLAALLTVGWIVSVAMTKNPAGFLVGIVRALLD